MESKKIIKIGTRTSALALAQTDLLIAAIQGSNPDFQCEKVLLNTKGDKNLTDPLASFGGKGVFVTEFEELLQRHEIDFAVHSAKDMPTELLEGLAIVGVLKREDPRDVLISRKNNPIQEIVTPVIGTSSLRRQCQIIKFYPNSICQNLRGNITTRIEKLKKQEYDGIILAAAGIKRLHLQEDPELEYEYFDCSQMVPAGGQGMIAIEGRIEDPLSQLIGELSDEKAGYSLAIERGILYGLGAGCHEAIGIISEIQEQKVSVQAMRQIGNDFLYIQKESPLERMEELMEECIMELKGACHG